VQVVAARRLFERGIMVKDGTALERMAEIDGVAFDKTGTLTLGRPSILNAEQIPPSAMGIAFGMTIGSSHPAARAIAEAAARGTNPIMAFDRIEEMPGLGLEASRDGDRYRLGRPEWVLEGRSPENGLAESVSYLTRNGELLAAFVMEDSVRPDARESVDDLVRQGLAVEIVSGDRAAVVEGLASKLGVHKVSSGLLPGEKVARVASHEQAHRKILMVGDGLNDAPALAAAHVSMAPATAADIGRNSADFVFLNESLSAVGGALGIARRSRTLIVQNFALAVGYNALAVPVAVLGYVTPLVAAVAMSLSSIIVVANALRLPSIPTGAMSPGPPRRK